MANELNCLLRASAVYIRLRYRDSINRGESGSGIQNIFSSECSLSDAVEHNLCFEYLMPDVFATFFDS